MNERNVCIGDIISVGPEVLLQVSLPRQPCFKLNHRFSLKKFAPVTYQTSRTGWYYRVLREGTVRAGDELRLVERKWSDWTVERVQEFLHRTTENLEMNEQLAQIEALGHEAKNQFQKRVAKARRKTRAKTEVWKDYRVVSRRMETPRVMSLVLEAEDINSLVDQKSPGLHARIKLPNGLVRSYSVVSAGEGKRMGPQFELGVALHENSRGGSRYIHENIKAGDVLQVGNITTSVTTVSSASKHIFIAGGIGITAFIDMLQAYDKIHFDLQLHYAIKSIEDLPFRERLERYGDRVILYEKSKGKRMDIRNIVRELPWNSHLYVCGPDRMMKAAQDACLECNVPPNEVHYEAFGADISGDPFEVEVANKGGKVLKVGEGESLLEVLKRELENVPSSCEVGNCGTCKVALKCGTVDHRGTAISEEEKETAMLSCVSRGIGRIVIDI